MPLHRSHAKFFKRPLALALALMGLTTLSQPVAAFSGLYVLGDSLSDVGNAALAVGSDPTQFITGNSYVPDRPYASGTLSNGKVWASYLSESLGLGASLPSLAGGTNYAFGGARTSGGDAPSLKDQAQMLLAPLKASGAKLSSDALYVVAGGGNNGFDALDAILAGANVESTLLTTANNYASDVGGIVDDLQAAGARHIVVWNTPNLGLTPLANAAGPLAKAGGTLLAQQMNGALATRLAGEQGVATFDVFSLLTNAVAQTSSSPATATFSNATHACGDLLAGCDPATSLFWDGIHPTTYGHQFIAAGMAATVAAIPEPSTYALMLGGLAAVGWLARRRAA